MVVVVVVLVVVVVEVVVVEVLLVVVGVVIISVVSISSSAELKTNIKITLLASIRLTANAYAIPLVCIRIR